MLKYQNYFNYKKFLFLVIALCVTIGIDVTLVKVYDLVDKAFIPSEPKLLLFSVNTLLCLFLIFMILTYLERSFRSVKVRKTFNIELLYRFALNSLFALGTLIGLLIFQQFYNGYYSIAISIFIITISYGTAAGYIIKLSLLFFSWYRSNHSWIVLLYFISMTLVTFNLIMTVISVDARLTVRPDLIREFFGGSMNLSFGKFPLIENLYVASSILSFVSIWITTVILINYYRESLTNAVWYWIILSLPLFYFLLNYLYKYIFTDLLLNYLSIDPITVSISLTLFLTLSKPVGGLIFAVAFWKISKVVSYEKNIKTYMIITGWGIFLLYGANQAVLQSLTPFPPFGLATIMVLIPASFLMLLGVYNSAMFVSANTDLRTFVRKQASESVLLGHIGQAEMQREIERSVKKITRHKYEVEKVSIQPIEFDEKELKDYVSFVANSVKKQRDEKDSNS